MKTQSTKNYDMFKFINGNRNIKDTRVQRIKNAIRYRDLRHENPIKINSKYQIMDGQHTLLACQELNVEVFYVFTDMTIEDIAKYNETRDNWSVEDHVLSKAQLGKPAYERIVKYHREWDLKVSLILEIFALNTSSIRTGGIVFGDATLEKGIKLYDVLCEIGKVFEGTFRNRFIRALKAVRQVEGFEFDVLLNKFKHNSSRLVLCPTANEYIKLLEEIYNYRNPNKLRLYKPF